MPTGDGEDGVYLRDISAIKDIPMTGEIPRDLGTLYQEPEVETKCIFLVMSHLY